jgi:hypothetical protein
MTDAERAIIRRAADLVEQGWCQGANFKVVDEKPCYCAFQALNEASTRILGIDPIHYVYRHLDSVGEGNSIVDYNDAPGRTQAEVVAMLRAVAEQA